MAHLIAITGGIGAGKSVVSRILLSMGYRVFDCDSEAKAIMDADEAIKKRIALEISEETIVGGSIDRARLAAIVFADERRLALLNSIVHAAVRDRIEQWSAETSGPAFVETAILYESGLNRHVAAEWRVEAPVELRISRVMERNGMSRQQVLDRMASQNGCVPDGFIPPCRHIVNDGIAPVLPQVNAALRELAACFRGLSD